MPMEGAVTLIDDVIDLHHMLRANALKRLQFVKDASMLTVDAEILDRYTSIEIGVCTEGHDSDSPSRHWLQSECNGSSSGL